MNRVRWRILFFLLFLLLFSFCTVGLAAVAGEAAPKADLFIPSAPDLKAKAYILMDADSGTVLAQKNADLRLPPASLTKLLTLYVASEALEQGRIRLDDKARISKQAWSQGGARMFLKLGSFVPVSELIAGIVVASGNDACVALAQYIAGDISSFAQLMNQAAEHIGMKDSHFLNSNGLPRSGHYSTAHDLARLTQTIIHQFPQHYQWYRQKWITYNNIRQPNRNRLLWRDPSVDGLKTGYTDAAGYCLVASALRQNTRLISVVMGTASDAARFDASQALLDWGFRYYHTRLLFRANQPLTQAHVWLARNKQVPLGLAKDIYITLPIGTSSPVTARLTLQPGGLRAPIVQGGVYGTMTLSLGKTVLGTTPLVALQDDPSAAWLFRVFDHLLLFFSRI